MDTAPAFFEAVFTLDTPPQNEEGWRDESTDDFFIFTSAFGTLRLRKRLSYPATFVSSAGSLLRFGYGNPQRGRMIAYSQLSLVAESSFVDQEFLYGEADCHQKTVVIQRDTACVLPVFAAKHGHTLALSNHSERLHDLTNEEKSLNGLAAINYMLFDDRYRPLLKNSEPLHDRVRLEWQKGRYTTYYPADGIIANPTEQTSEPRHFKQALESTLDTYWERYNNIGFQLSGGLDSATAPGYYADQGKQVITATLGLPGTMGQLQRAKIHDMIQRFNLENHTVDLDPNKHFPFAGMALTGQWGVIGEYNDLHLVATRQLADYLASRGIATVFSGVGGDELCQNITVESVLPTGAEFQKQRLSHSLPHYTTKAFEQLYRTVQANVSQERDRPIPSIAYSVMLTNLGFNNTFIDRNIWPVAPLSDPKLFLFTQSIPAWHRYDKNLLRIYQFARDFPESIIRPKTTEDFSEFIHLCKPVLNQLFEASFNSSRMAEWGFIDQPALLGYSQKVTEAPFDPSDTRILELIRLLAVEINLQHFYKGHFAVTS